MKRAWSFCVAAFAAACGGEAPVTPEPAIDPATFDIDDAGPFQCGHRVLSTTYTPRAGGPSRTLPVHVWYPTTATDGEHSRYRGIFQDPFAWEDAPVAKPAWPTGFPVLLHSHGYMGFAGNSYRMMCHFAMHGWVAIAPEHVGNTLTDTPDPLPLSAFSSRPLDVRAAFDHVVGLPAEDPLAGTLDEARVAVSGHSFGIFTAWALAGASFDRAVIESQCASGKIGSCSDEELAMFDAPLADPRVRAAMPMAGGKHAFFGDHGLDAVEVPVLLMTGSLDDVGGDDVFANVTQVALSWADVEGGCHQLYGLGNTSVGGESCKQLPDEEGFALVNPYLLATARYHVLGERGERVRGLVEDDAGLSPKIRVQRKGP